MQTVYTAPANVVALKHFFHIFIVSINNLIRYYFILNTLCKMAAISTGTQLVPISIVHDVNSNTYNLDVICS